MLYKIRKSAVIFAVVSFSLILIALTAKAATFKAELFGFPDSNPNGFFEYSLSPRGADFEVLNTSINVKFADGQTINFTNDDFQGNRSTLKYWFQFKPNPDSSFPDYILQLGYSDLKKAQPGDEIPATAAYRSRDANGSRITNEKVQGFMRIN